MADDRHPLDLQRLERALLDRSGRREGRELRFLCPCHDDRNPSARFNPEKSSWFCDVCHQGGGWRDLATRIGHVTPPPAREIEATYPYQGEDGRLLYEVVRYRPKAFACRRPDGAGGWIWDLQGIPRVLYRLPPLLAAVAAGHVVHLVEGEKDADSLRALGLTATTHPGGAGKWRPEYAQPLRGAIVLLLPDNDDPGRRHTESVANALRSTAARIAHLNLPNLPPKGDVSDWLAAHRGEGLDDDALRARFYDLVCAAFATRPISPGGLASSIPASAAAAISDTAAIPPVTWPTSLVSTLTCGNTGELGAPSASAALAIAPLLPIDGPTTQADHRPLPFGLPHLPGQALPLSLGCPLPTPPAPPLVGNVRRLIDVTPQPVHFLWHPYVPLGKLTLLDGDPGAGKSWITAALATAGSHGRGLPGTPPFDPFTTLVLSEDPPGDVLRPRLDLLGADSTRVLTFDTLEDPLDLAAPACVLRLEQIVSAHQVRLLVLDPIQAFLGAKTDIYRPNEVRAVLAPLLRLAHRHTCALLILRHITKARPNRSLYAGQGSIDFIAAARSVLLAGTAPDDPNRRALVHLKSNLAASGPALGYHFEGATFHWDGPSRLTAADLLAAESQSDDPGAEDEARLFLRDLLAAQPLSVRTILTAARDAGIAEKTLKRAKRRESVRALRQGFGPGSLWLWTLPPAAPLAEEGQPQTWPPSTSDDLLRPEPDPADPLASDKVIL